MKFAFVLTCALSAVWAGGAFASDFVIAERGKPAAYPIVVAEKVSDCERYAAEELRDYLAKSTDVRFKIEHSVPSGPAIVVGSLAQGLSDAKADAALGEDGFRIVVRDGKLLIVGSPKRGALYGVYELLERFAGVRWYTSWHKVVPKCDRVAVPGDFDRAEIPAFEMREPFWYDVLQHPEFAARLRVNSRSWRITPTKFGGMPYRFGGGLSSCHTFNTLVPPDEFYPTHPEYFSLVGGKRLKEPSQLCLTNPDVVKLVTERVLERIRKDPTAKFYGVSQNDWDNYCECPNCKAVDDEEGSHAGTMVRFVNAVAEGVEKEFPHAIVETLAYHYTRNAPKKTRLRHNVMPCLCSSGCERAFSMEESRYPQNVDFRKDIIDWGRQTDRLYIWDYVTDFNGYTTPTPNVLTLQDNLRFFQANGVKEMFSQGDMNGMHADFAELKAWISAKWMWNPNIPSELLYDEFFRGYYGPAAPFVREYFDYMHRVVREKLILMSQTKRPPGSSKPYSDEFFAQGDALWKRAIAAVANDPIYSYNVRMGAFSLDAARLEWLRKTGDRVLWLSNREPDFSKMSEMQAIAKSLLARMQEAKEPIVLAELGNIHHDMKRDWGMLADNKTATPVRGATQGELQDNFLSIMMRGKWGDYVDDPKASDGRALKLFGTHHDWCVRFFMNRLGYDEGCRYRLRMRVRVESVAEGAAFSAGVYDPVAKKACGSHGYKTSEVTNEYAWYDVAEFEPNDNQWFWAAPGVFDKNGKSAVKAIYIDKISIEKLGN